MGILLTSVFHAPSCGRFCKKKTALFYKSHKSMNIKHIASSDLSSVLFYSRKVNIPHSSTARPLVKTSSHIFGTQTIKIDQTLV